MNSEHSSSELKASDIPLHLIPAKKLSPGIRNKLSLLLNPPKIRETFVERIPRDFEGLGYLMGFDISTVQQAEWSGDATKYLILKWISEDDHSIEDLLKMIKRMERYDVLGDITPLLDKSVEDFLKFLKKDTQAKEALTALGKLSLIEENTGEALKIMTRTEWGARPATDIQKYKHKLKLVFIHHTKVSLPSSVETVRHLQSVAMGGKEHKRDISFNFLIDQEGEIFEGTGWDCISCQNFQYARMSVSIGLIGDFNVQTPSSSMIESLKRLIHQGITENKIEKKYSLMGYSDAVVSDSPGKNVMEVLTTMLNYKSIKKTNITLKEQEEIRIRTYNYLRSNSLSPPVKFGALSPPIKGP